MGMDGGKSTRLVRYDDEAVSVRAFDQPASCMSFLKVIAFFTALASISLLK